VLVSAPSPKQSFRKFALARTPSPAPSRVRSPELLASPLKNVPKGKLKKAPVTNVTEGYKVIRGNLYNSCVTLLKRRVAAGTRENSRVPAIGCGLSPRVEAVCREASRWALESVEAAALHSGSPWVLALEAELPSGSRSV
jgi:hypothetical protein